MLDQIIDLIASYQTITIYPHQHADGDALGSGFGLQQVLLAYFPDKHIYVLGTNTKDNGVTFPLFDVIDNAVIAESLAIVVDTANKERIDDLRYAMAKQIIKIDHHPSDDNYGDFNYVFPDRSSTSELVVDLARRLSNGKPIEIKAATYLYSGVLSDTMSFSTSATNAASLEAASYLASCGVALDEVAYQFRAKKLPVFQFITELRNQLVVEGEALVYAIVPKSMYQAYGVSFEDAKGNVSEFSRITGLLVWCVFIEQEDGIYQGSLRSRKVAVNDIAALLGGGGHKHAAGVKCKDLDEVHMILEKMRQRIKEVQDETEISL